MSRVRYGGVHQEEVLGSAEEKETRERRRKKKEQVRGRSPSGSLLNGSLRLEDDGCDSSLHRLGAAGPW